MTDSELMSTIGGASYASGTFLNSLVRVLTTFLEIGRSIGSAINFAVNKKVC